MRSEPGGRGGRARRYLRADLERLKARHDARAGHGPVAAGALRFGEPVLASALTCIEGGELRYRGHAAVTLAAGTTFEAVAELLWSGALPASPPAWRAAGIGLRARSLAALLPRGAHPLATLALAVPALAAADPGRFVPDVEAELPGPGRSSCGWPPSSASPRTPPARGPRRRAAAWPAPSSSGSGPVSVPRRSAP